MRKFIGAAAGLLVAGTRMEKTMYHNICIDNPAQCNHHHEESLPWPEKLPWTTVFNADLFEDASEGKTYSFNQAELHLVRKKKGAIGPNADKLIDGKIYLQKKIIIGEDKESWMTIERESWVYRESKILELVNGHPNIIAFHGMVLSSSETLPDFLFDYIETKDAKPLLKHGKHSTDALINEADFFDRISNVRRFMRELLLAIDHMHSLGVMHRDLKPSNMVIDKQGKLTVIDFDLAEFFNPDIKLDYIVGAKGYKAPESFLR